MSTLDVSAGAGKKNEALRRARLIRSALVLILGPTLLYAIYLLVIAPPQYHAEGSYALRGSQAGATDALSVLGIVAPTSTTADAKVVENYIRSDAMVAALRERYGFDKAYDKLSLDPTAYLSPKASLRRAKQFWRNKVEVVTDPSTAGATVRVSAYTPEDSLRLARGVLQLSEELVNNLPQRAINDLIAAADREIEAKRRNYEQIREQLTEYQGRQYSGVGAATPAQQAIGLVGSIESQLAAKRTELATARETYQPTAPQLVGIQREIAALEAERDRAIQRALQAPGERAAAGEIEAQSLLVDYQIAQTEYQTALRAAENARRQQIIDRKYIVSYIPPHMPESSDWWPRLANILAVLIGAALLWSVGALIYSIVRDHIE